MKTSIELSSEDTPFNRARMLFVISGLPVNEETAAALGKAEQVMKAYRALDLEAQKAALEELERELEDCDSILESL